MTLGELDYENDFIKAFPPYPEAVNIVFVLFALSMPIILMNMLVRKTIAILNITRIKLKRYRGDTDMIRIRKAKLLGVSLDVDCLGRVRESSSNLY